MVNRVPIRDTDRIRDILVVRFRVLSQDLLKTRFHISAPETVATARAKLPKVLAR